MINLRKVFVATAFAASAALASFAALAADANVTGTWTMSVESPQGARESTLNLKQEGTAVSGTIKGARGENPISGTVSGNDVKLSYTISFGEREITMNYEGKVDGNTITGKIVTQRGEQPFTAKKQ